MNKKYVHGYAARESERLVDQATTLADILHSDTRLSGRKQCAGSGMRRWSANNYFGA